LLVQGEGGKLRRAPSWRKKFRSKDAAATAHPGLQEPVGSGMVIDHQPLTPDRAGAGGGVVVVGMAGGGGAGGEPYTQPSPRNVRRANSQQGSNNVVSAVTPVTAAVPGGPVSLPASVTMETASALGPSVSPVPTSGSGMAARKADGSKPY
jgi:hypothetical protein